MDEEHREDLRRLRKCALTAGGTVAFLAALRLMEDTLGVSLSFLGIFPRSLRHLGGVVTGPLIHGDWSHLFANALPLFVLCTALFYHYRAVAGRVALAVYVVGGLSVWLLGRPAFHIGASGLNYGFVSFIFMAGVLRRDRASIALALLVTFLYGSMIWGVFPTVERVSWEAHLYSALVGVGAAVWHRLRHPVAREKDDWETRYAQGINEDNEWTDYEGYAPGEGDDPERGIYR